MHPQTEQTPPIERLPEREMRRTGMRGSSIAGGVFLIGLAMLVLTNWW